MLADILLVTILLICVITDLKSRKIYNKVIFPGLLVAVVLHLIMGGWAGLISSLIGFGVGLAILFIPYMLGGMGAGDVKLLALIGALKGAVFVLNTAVYMAIVGGLIAVAILIFRKGFIERMKSIFYFFYGLRYGTRIPLGMNKNSLSATYPYGVAIAAGAVIALVDKGWLFT